MARTRLAEQALARALDAAEAAFRQLVADGKATLRAGDLDQVSAFLGFFDPRPRSLAKLATH